MRLAFGSAKCAKVLLIDAMLVNGDMMADAVVLIEKMFSWLPLMYNMNAFIKSCCLLADWAKRESCENVQSIMMTKTMTTR